MWTGFIREVTKVIWLYEIKLIQTYFRKIYRVYVYSLTERSDKDTRFILTLFPIDSVGYYI